MYGLSNDEKKKILKILCKEFNISSNTKNGRLILSNNIREEDCTSLWGCIPRLSNIRYVAIHFSAHNGIYYELTRCRYIYHDTFNGTETDKLLKEIHKKYLKKLYTTVLLCLKRTNVNLCKDIRLLLFKYYEDINVIY